MLEGSDNVLNAALSGVRETEAVLLKSMSLLLLYPLPLLPLLLPATWLL